MAEISRVDYIDKHFAKLFNFDGGYYDIIKSSQILGEAKLGDSLVYEFDENQDRQYKVYKKSTSKVFDLSELCLVESVDAYHVYLLQNGGGQIKIKRNQEEIAPLDLVYLNGDEIVKDQKYSLYFQKALNEFGDNVKVKGKFSIKRVVLEDFHKHAVSLCDIDNLDKFIVEPDNKFEQNMSYGDIYFDIRLGKNQKYVLDVFNMTDLNSYYSSILGKKIDLSSGADKNEVLEKTKELLKYYYDKKAVMEKVSDKAETKLPYDENDVLGEFYLEEEEEDQIGKYYRGINYNEDAEVGEIKIYLKDLPFLPARESDSVVMIKDDFGKTKFYYTNKYVCSSLQDKIDAEERRLSYLNKGGVWR